MEKATLAISLPRTTKDFIVSKMQEGRFSTPREYIRSLIRQDRDLNGPAKRSGNLPDSDAWPSVRQDGAHKTTAVGRARYTSGTKPRRPSGRGR